MKIGFFVPLLLLCAAAALQAGAESDRKTRQLLHKIRKHNENAIIVLTGCMVQAFPEKAKELESCLLKIAKEL